MEKENQTENQNPEQAAPTGELNAELISRAIKVFVPPTPVGEEGKEGEPTSDPILNTDDVRGTHEVPAEPVMTKVGE